MELRVIKFDTSNNLFVKSTIFPHRDIRTCIWTSPEGKTRNQIGHVLILVDRIRHSSILDVQSSEGLTVKRKNILWLKSEGERLALSKRPVKKMDVETFNFKKLLWES
jgi:hypothetical protein